MPKYSGETKLKGSDLVPFPLTTLDQGDGDPGGRKQAPSGAVLESDNSRSITGWRSFLSAVELRFIVTVKTPRASAPKSWEARRRSLRSATPAEIKSSAHTTTCATTNALRRRAGRWSVANSPRLASPRRERDAWIAGISPKPRVAIPAVTRRK